MAVFGLQVTGVAALVSAILVLPSLQDSYTGPTCQSQIENNHANKEILLQGQPSGSVFKIPLDKVTTTTTTPKPGEKVPCQVPYQGNPALYDWLQVLEETGGQPGKVNATRKTPQGHYQFEYPCERPLSPEGDEDKVYEYRQTDLKSVFRMEDGYVRFAGTKSEFVDIRGTVVWTPPKSAQDPRVYTADYFLDDTGLWLNVKKRNCTFHPGPVLTCKELPFCRCSDDGELRCKEHKFAGPNLLASLVG